MASAVSSNSRSLKIAVRASACDSPVGSGFGVLNCRARMMLTCPIAAAVCPSSFIASALIRYISARRKYGKLFGCESPFGTPTFGENLLNRGPSFSAAWVSFPMFTEKTSGLPARSFTGWFVSKLNCCPTRKMLRRASAGSNALYVSAIVAKPFHGPPCTVSWL